MRWGWRRLVRQAFGPYLAVTNTVSCGLLLAAGDTLQQTIERHNHSAQQRDWARTGRMLVVGFVLGPLNHVWYKYLDVFLPGTTGRIIGRKIILDQLFGAPTFSFTFIVGMSKMEGQSTAASLAEFRSKFPFIYLVDWFVWPPAQLINFYFLPTRFRAMFVYFVDLCWYTFNSYIKHNQSFMTQHKWLNSFFNHYESSSPRLDVLCEEQQPSDETANPDSDSASPVKSS